MKEVKIRFGNICYRSAIGSLLSVSCYTMPDIAFPVSKLAKYSNNPGVVHYRALLHLIGYIKDTSHKLLKFYSDMKESPTFKMLKDNNIFSNEDTTVTF